LRASCGFGELLPWLSQTRRLAAILAADVAGYSRLIGADVGGTLNQLRSIRIDIIEPTIARYRGRIVKTTGDGLLAEFTSVVDALQWASEIQSTMAGQNADIAAEKRIEFRIGIHQGPDALCVPADLPSGPA
jgi:adenylate cyclase